MLQMIMADLLAMIIFELVSKPIYKMTTEIIAEIKEEKNDTIISCITNNETYVSR